MPVPLSARAATDNIPFTEWFAELRAQVDRALADHFARFADAATIHSRLHEASAYSIRAGGKRLRPILIVESGRICGGTDEVLMPVAMAMECVHTYSLIHDDLPAMDDDALRRGVPTNHTVFGEATAILAGDWLAAQAFALVAGEPIPRDRVPDLVSVLAAGTQDMILGQAADMAGEQAPTDEQLVEFIHRHKTASLIAASCRLGSLAAGAGESRIEALTTYGRHLGLAFQIVDDLLDCTSSTASLGKTAGKDACEAKQTYPAAFGLERSREQAKAQVNRAIDALAEFGAAAVRLRELAAFVVERNC